MRHSAILWEDNKKGYVHCYLCAKHCIIGDGKFGYCGVRENDGGELVTYAYGSVIADHVDPIEKKPFFHFLPQSLSYSVATIGCNFHCGFCQNWQISQAKAKNSDYEGIKTSPEDIVNKAIKNNCKSISYTYTEPTIYMEYAYDTAKIAKENGLYNTFVTNGYMTDEAIDFIRPYLAGASVDLKSFREPYYNKVCKGTLRPVLDCIRSLKKEGVWIEITTLIIPGFNDSREELSDIASFIGEIGKDIPWHLSRFHPDFEMLDVKTTPRETLEMAKEIGEKNGLNYVYMGNVANGGDTICPGCGSLLIERDWFEAYKSISLAEDGRCKKCGTNISGLWR